MRKFISGILLGITLLAALYFYIRGKEYKIELTQAQIQQNLTDRSPIKKCALRVLCLTLSDPVVKLEEGGDRIRFAASAALNLTLNDKQLHGFGDIAGRIRYEQQRGEFYLDAPDILRLTIEGIPEKYAQKVEELAKESVAEYLAVRPLYRLKSTDIKQSIVRLVLRSVRVTNGVLIITVGLPG
jgi:hypothetical protein